MVGETVQWLRTLGPPATCNSDFREIQCVERHQTHTWCNDIQAGSVEQAGFEFPSVGVKR